MHQALTPSSPSLRTSKVHYFRGWAWGSHLLPGSVTRPPEVRGVRGIRITYLDSGRLEVCCFPVVSDSKTLPLWARRGFFESLVGYKRPLCRFVLFPGFTKGAQVITFDVMLSVKFLTAKYFFVSAVTICIYGKQGGGILECSLCWRCTMHGHRAFVYKRFSFLLLDTQGCCREGEGTRGVPFWPHVSSPLRG